ncbi:HAD family hydrolase [Agitococcus lubricus]|uniref:Hydroxymethylpyrimidine pyrophosphatase-like HAD family hydrolase n=1 Tax=Agitococcus lubricus TaxID=1077255 RepID=A0A2T5J2J9_9GAMM|nr:HAD family hydrolase [Agitococcus lubricus]PTQ90750.1 hydroxymethylpyrimidine pyrophosphatase-like HAD family hydrolase [Agitococcus lubricus]
MIKPLFLMDLDDTLLQTARKMPADMPRQVAALDKQGQPLSFTNPKQRAFIDWLLTHADVVPVTARSVDAFKRVQIPFNQGAICAHGAVILTRNGDIDPDWHAVMQQQLNPYAMLLEEVREKLARIGQQLNLTLRTWLVEEQGLACYALAKQSGHDDSVLADVEQQIQQQLALTAFYIHRNANNLAILPKVLHKKFAVDYWLQQDKKRHGERPILGFGDSLSDVDFLQRCDWWATPQQGQLAKSVYQQLGITE